MKVNLEVHGNNAEELYAAADDELEQLAPGRRWNKDFSARRMVTNVDGRGTGWVAEVNAECEDPE